jgi:hypothetical protein
MTVSVTGGTTDPAVTVSLDRPHDFAFIRVLGVNSATVRARAKAIKVSLGGSSGVVPWAVTEATMSGVYVGTSTILKYDATGVENGNFGAIRIDGPGSATYNTSVRYGSTTFACAASAPNCTTGACPGTYPATCAETAPECDGPDCTPQTGNMTGNTRTGVNFRMNNTSATCDEFGEAFAGPDADGKWHLNYDCNPWVQGDGYCTSATDLCSRRVIIIPIVEDFGNGASDPLRITRFALMWLEGYEGTCTGNSCEIRGTFVAAEITTRGLAGNYDEDASIQFTKLVE